MEIKVYMAVHQEFVGGLLVGAEVFGTRPPAEAAAEKSPVMGKVVEKTINVPAKVNVVADDLTGVGVDLIVGDEEVAVPMTFNGE